MKPSDRLSVEARALAYQIDNSDAYGTEQVTLSEAWTSGHAAGLSEALELADAVSVYIENESYENFDLLIEALAEFKRAKGEK